MRLYPISNWSAVLFGGNDLAATTLTGTTANSWFVGNNNGTFYITKNGSTSSNSGYLKASTETTNSRGYWEFYHRVGVNGSNVSY